MYYMLLSYKLNFFDDLVDLITDFYKNLLMRLSVDHAMCCVVDVDDKI